MPQPSARSARFVHVPHVATDRIKSFNHIRVHRQIQKRGQEVFWRCVHNWTNPHYEKALPKLQTIQKHYEARWIRSSQLLMELIRLYVEFGKLDVCMMPEDLQVLSEDMQNQNNENMLKLLQEIKTTGAA
ncbi:MAG: hypothetical protein AAB388_04500 [Patescibacteria group bacterium]